MVRPLYFVAVAAALVAAACGSSRQQQSSSPPASGGASRPVIFIGLDAADWQLLDDYIANASMPNLARLVREGTSGVLDTIRPPLSPLVWTTMMTGVGPLEHGILDFAQFDPATGAKEPITSSVRRVPAIWNMASSQGKRVGIIGLWATYPAEHVNGTIVSDRLFTFLFNESAPPTGLVSPPGKDVWARDALKRANDQIEEAAVKAYLPWLSHDEYARNADSRDPYAQPISALRRILIDTQVYDSLGRDLVSKDHPDLTVVYFEGTDTIGHVFAPFAPPKQPQVSQTDYDRYHEVPQRYFQHIDDVIGAYRQLAEASNAVLMLASDHGFYWKEGRPTEFSSNANSTAAKWHRGEGMYVLWGNGIAATQGHTAHGSVQQVCATLLALLGLPPGRDVNGAPLPGATASSQSHFDYFAQYHPSAAPTSTNSAANAETLAKLKSLGYIGDSGPTSSPTAGNTRTPGSYNNEGVILKESGKTDAAIPAFEHALSLDPESASSLWNLSDVLYARGSDLDRSDQLLLQAVAHGLPDGPKLLIGRAIGYERSGHADRSLLLVSAALKSNPREPQFWLFQGMYRVGANDCRSALADFDQAERLQPDNAAAYASDGVASICAGDHARAVRAFQKSLTLDPNQPKVREFLQSLGRIP